MRAGWTHMQFDNNQMEPSERWEEFLKGCVPPGPPVSYKLPND
jgi:hypothetical protein